MFDGLIEILMQWLGQAWCWLLTQIVLLAAALVQLVGSLLPDVEVPSWFAPGQFSDLSLSLMAWVFPLDVVFWGLMLWVGYEIVLAVIIPLYRSFMDLL